MTLVTFGRMTPVGRREILKALPPTTTVCPALPPPLYRTTMSNPSPRRSTIFPLASSPHCNPTTHVPGIVTNRRLSRCVSTRLTLVRPARGVKGGRRREEPNPPDPLPSQGRG